METKSGPRQYWGLFFLTLLTLLAACRAEDGNQAKDNELIFQSLIQSDWGNGSAYQENSSAIMIVSQPSEIPDLGDLVSLNAQTQLISLNYRTRFAVAVFQGHKGSSGYGVQVERIVRNRDIVYVFAQFMSPEIDREVQDIETSPYDLVRVRKSGEWNHEVAFHLVVDGMVVASTMHFVP